LNSGRSPRLSLVSRRQALGLLILLVLLLGGRVLRREMLVGPEGDWRHELWLDELVKSAEAGPQEKRQPAPKLTTPLPINSCSLDSLTLLPRVGPVLAARIAEARRQGIVFRCPSDLQLVKGIGPALSARLAPLVIFTADSLQAPAGSNSARDSIPALDR
jgi:predicted flap endonuclease-1-like 5' DNA nuclease